MNIIELKNRCDEIITAGGGESNVMFDTEAGTFQYHLVRTKELIYDAEYNELMGSNMSIMHCDNKDISHGTG